MEIPRLIYTFSTLTFAIFAIRTYCLLLNPPLSLTYFSSLAPPVRVSNPKTWDDVGYVRYRGVMWDNVGQCGIMWDNVG